MSLIHLGAHQAGLRVETAAVQRQAKSKALSVRSEAQLGLGLGPVVVGAAISVVGKCEALEKGNWVPGPA